MTNDLVLLIPGLLGYTHLGDLNYFPGVREQLSAHLGPEVAIEVVPTVPTGRLSLRAEAIVRRVHALEAERGRVSRIHLIGHSTGGIDARLLASPDSGLPLEGVASRICSVSTLVSPHRGSPLAGDVYRLDGQQILMCLALLATSRPGRYALYALSRKLIALSRIDPPPENWLDLLVDALLSDIHPDAAHDVWDYLSAIAAEQGALSELTPQGMVVFNERYGDREGVTYTSFLAASPPPGSATERPETVLERITPLLYRLIYSRTSMTPPGGLPRLPPAYRSPCSPALPIDEQSNDGVVPTLSQAWGTIGGVYCGDHLDVVGQYPREVMLGGRPVYQPGWLRSGAMFREARFVKLWSDIASAVQGAMRTSTLRQGQG